MQPTAYEPPRQTLSTFFSKEAVGGIMLLAATVLALIFANTPLAHQYFSLRDTYLGWDLTSDFSLKLSIGHWAADALLAVFFFMAGLELKKEFVTGELRNPGKAAVPVLAAIGGIALPSLIYVFVNRHGSSEAIGGWAIPAATDIAFAVAVLAVVGSHLPVAIRTFLLTLAVVDDLIAITIIALFYTSDLKIHYLLLALIPIAIYGVVARKYEALFHKNAVASWVILLPIGAIVWALFLNAGIHATIAGVVLAFTIPVRENKNTRKAQAHHGLAEVIEHRVRPFSAGFCVPLFAFFSAGVAVGGWNGFTSALREPIALGIIAALILGKIVGITVMTWLATRIPGINLDRDIQWIDVIGVASLAGIGFTVSLLIAELSFGIDSVYNDYSKIAILTASVGAASIGSLILGLRNRRYRRATS